jgi:hypothetical protein
VNPGRVLAGGGEWTNVLLSRRLGRYGPDGAPGAAGTQAPPFGPRPPVYGQVDFDGSNEGAGGLPTGRLGLPGDGAPPLSCFPLFPPGYGNGSGDVPGSERWEHPLLSDPFRRSGDDRTFGAHQLEALLRYGDTNSAALSGELLAQCPVNFRDPRRRRLVTTHSFDLDQPGVPPWLFDRDASGYRPAPLAAESPPTGPPVPFPSLALRPTVPVPPDSDFRTPGAPATDPSVDWRANVSAVGRLNLNRFLPPYPHQGQGLTADTISAVPLVGYGIRFDAGDPAIYQQFLAAQAARQQLADDVYRILLAVTGVAAPQNPASPTDAELAPRRWLAQLAVNIVDLLDKDDLNTPFNSYTARDAGAPAFDVGAVSAGNPELPRYWVFGTELPRVVLNEVLAEYHLPDLNTSGTFAVRVFAELFNPLPAGPPPAATQPQDSLTVLLSITGPAGPGGYSPYRVVIANTNTSPGGPLLPRPYTGDNVLGTADVVQVSTNDADFAQNPGTVGNPTVTTQAAVSPQQFFLLGPPGLDARGTIAPPVVPANSPLLQSTNMQYAVAFTPPNTWSPDYRAAGLIVLLRRLANPYLPPDPRPTIDNSPNPAYNPFVTIDFLSGIPLNNATDPQAVYSSWGKLQPYAAHPSQVAPQVSSFQAPTRHTFGRVNDPVPPGGHYDWLVHLDRRPVSPAELLQVSGFAPHDLTRRFVSPDSPGGPGKPFRQRMPWFDPSNRLYRVFELLAARHGLPGTGPGGRVAGKINLNTIWDPETLLALCDPQPGNCFAAADVYNPARPQDPATLFGRLMALRTPGGTPAQGDRPFRGMAVGYSPAPGDPLYPPGGDPVNPGGSGIDDTILRPAAPGAGPDALRLFEVAGADHPYLRYELLTKVFNQVTTRSNVFAAWLTVGFFEVTDRTTLPVKLGGELGRPEGRDIRHRMFAVVDRAGLARFSTRSRTAVTFTTPAYAVEPSVTPASMSGTDPGGRPWQIREGAFLTVDSGDAQEAVRVTAVTPTAFTARFIKAHASGFRIIGRGNPGPQSRFNPAQHPEVVPYFSIIN